MSTETFIEHRLAHWLQRREDGVFCTRCRHYLWDCPSCPDLSCRCALSWVSNVRAQDRKGMPYQHYTREFVPIMRDPFLNKVDDEEGEDDD